MNDDQTQKPISANIPTTPPNPQGTGVEINLEEEFQKELGGISIKSDQPIQKTAKLEETKKVLNQKISMLEIDVKKKLQDLKEIKTKIEEEIKKIKDLKETEGKIGEELTKINDLEDKRGEIDKEIKVLEEKATAL